VEVAATLRTAVGAHLLEGLEALLLFRRQDRHQLGFESLTLGLGSGHPAMGLDHQFSYSGSVRPVGQRHLANLIAHIAPVIEAAPQHLDLPLMGLSPLLDLRLTQVEESGQPFESIARRALEARVLTLWPEAGPLTPVTRSRQHRRRQSQSQSHEHCCSLPHHCLLSSLYRFHRDPSSCVFRAVSTR
jgi:hypothetical protein